MVNLMYHPFVYNVNDPLDGEDRYLPSPKHTEATYIPALLGTASPLYSACRTASLGDLASTPTSDASGPEPAEKSIPVIDEHASTPLASQALPPTATEPHTYLSPEALASLLTLGVTADVWDLIMSSAEGVAREVIRTGSFPLREGAVSAPPPRPSNKKVPPRPSNRFIVFRKCVQRAKNWPPEAQSRQKNLSQVLGRVWMALPASRQQAFEEAAKVLKVEHEKKHPGYVYQPERKAGVKRPKRTHEEIDGVGGDEGKENKRPRSKRASPSVAKPRLSKKGKEKASSAALKAAATLLTQRIPSLSVPPSAPVPPPARSSTSSPPPTLSTTLVPLHAPLTMPPSSLHPTPMIGRPPSAVPPTLPSIRGHTCYPYSWTPDLSSGYTDWLSSDPLTSSWDYPVPVSRMLRPLPNRPSATLGPSTSYLESSTPVQDFSHFQNEKYLGASALASETFSVEAPVATTRPTSWGESLEEDSLLPPLENETYTDWDNPGPFPEFISYAV